MAGFAKRRIDWKVLIASFAVVILVAFAGSIFTSSTVKSEWYNSIKPPLTPPSWVFPVVWNILFFLIALSLYFLWISARDKRQVITVFGTNFVLNIMWSILFFKFQNPLLAFYEILMLWVSIIAMLNLAWKTDKKSFYLLLPYFLWVSFAMLLNYFII